MSIDREIDDENEVIADQMDADVRSSRDPKWRDKHRTNDGDLSDSEDEGEGGRRNRAEYKSKGPGIMDPLKERQQQVENGNGVAGVSDDQAKADLAAVTASNGESTGNNSTKDIEMSNI